MAGQCSTSVSLRVFGKFALCRNDQAIAVTGLKTRALLAYLACQEGKPQSRERLIGLLWGDRFEAQARQSLRHTLSELRKVLGPDALEVDRGLVCLKSAFQSDIAQFKRLLLSGEPSGLRDAVALYRDELLADVSLREKPFMDWLAAERALLRDLAAGALGELVDSASEPLAPKERLALAQRAVALDPYREQAHRQLLRALAELGRRNDAVAHYRQLERALQAELGVKPEPATRVLLESLLVAPTTDASGGTPLDHRPRDQSRKPAIVVLPFTNLSSNPEQGYFSDGVTEDIITELSRFQQFAIVPRSAAFRWRETDADVGRIGRALGVQFVVEGSVRRRGEEMRITAQLADAASGEEIWAERFDREPREIFAVQDEIVRTIVGTLAGRVQAAGAERAQRKPPASLDAYECVLRGNSLPLGDTGIETEKRRLYELAIALDPAYGHAHALLAQIAFLDWFRDMSGSDVALDRAFDLAKKAVALADNDVMCQFVLGWTHLFRKSFALAEEYYERALALNPNDPEQIARMGFLRAFLGRPDDALDWLKRARTVDPFFNPVWYSHSMGYAYFFAHQYDAAIAALERSVTMPFWVQAYLAACYALTGKTDAAREFAHQVLHLAPEFSSARLVAKEPFKRRADGQHLVSGLLKAGLPE